MNTLIHADIFFFVTTIAIIVVGLLCVVVLIYLIKILSHVKSITEQVRDEAALFREDIHDLRDSVRSEGFKLKSLFDFGYSFLRRRKSKKSK